MTQQQRIAKLLEEWEKVKKELEELFAERDHKSAVQPMKKGTDLFLEILICVNKLSFEPSHNLHYENFRIKPINVADRLNFIIKRPGLYQSFIQLTELINEIHKQFQKQEAIKKASRH